MVEDLARKYNLTQRVIREYRRLQSCNAQHKLLGYIHLTSEGDIELSPDMITVEMFISEFGKNNVRYPKMLANYLKALIVCANETEGITCSPRDKKKEPSVLENSV